jgi:hypothetical protein
VHISCFRGPPLVSVTDPSVTSSFTPSPIQERQQGSGDRDEIRETEHALLHLPRRPVTPRHQTMPFCLPGGPLISGPRPGGLAWPLSLRNLRSPRSIDLAASQSYRVRAGASELRYDAPSKRRAGFADDELAMSRRKCETIGAMNERDFPHIVELALPPGGFSDQGEGFEEFHRERGIPIRPGRGRHEATQFYVRFCFPNATAADACHANADAQLPSPSPPRRSTSIWRRT